MRLTLPFPRASLSLMLPEIHIASPCTADWERMTGNNRVRHCAQCNLNVYNFAAMTSREIERLVAASKGKRLCGRLYRRVDGTILTRDCPVGVKARIRRVSRRVRVALSAAMSVGIATAQTQQREPSSLVQIQQAETGIHLAVFDVSGAVLPKAQILVANQAGERIAEGATNEVGQIRFLGLTPGTYVLTVRSVGFETSPKLNVAVQPRQMVDLDVTLQPGPPVVMGVCVMPGLSEPQPQASPLDLELIPESTSPDVQAPESAARPRRTPAQPENPVRKFFHALGRILGA